MTRSIYPYCPAGWAEISPVVRADGAPGCFTGRCAAAKETGRTRAVPYGAVNGPQG